LEIILILSSVVIAYLFYKFIETRALVFLRQKNITQYNYAGRQVLNCGGLIILIPCLIALLPLSILNLNNFFVFITIMLSLTFCGLLDDLLGDSSFKGLIKHISALMHGRISTGIIKAFIGCLMGFLLALTRQKKLIPLLMDTILFALTVNLINLLDLRPGRAIKGFVLFLALTGILTRFTEIHFIIPVLTVLALYINGEMKEVYMLGDAGANLLGGILGYYWTSILSTTFKGLTLLLLIFLHIFTEFFSLSKVIERNPLLKKIDMLGRKYNEI